MDKIETLDIKSILIKEFFIPFYQRDFEWKEEHIFHFLKYFENPKPNIFPGGNFTLKHHENNKLELIDGQQRLVTIFIIDLILNKISKNKNNNKNFLNYANQTTNAQFYDFYKNYEDNNLDKINVVNKFNEIYFIIYNYFSDLDKNQLNSFIDVFYNTNFILLFTISDGYQVFMDINTTKSPLTIFDMIRALFVQDSKEYSYIDKINKISTILNEIKDKKEKWNFEKILIEFLLTYYFKYIDNNDFSAWQTKDKNIIDKIYFIIKEENNDRLKILNNLLEYITTIKNIQLNENIKDLENLNLTSITTHNLLTYLYVNCQDKNIRKKVIDEVLIPYFGRNLLIDFNDNFIKEMNFKFFYPFYKYMNKNKSKDIFESYYIYFNELIPTDEQIKDAKKVTNLNYFSYSSISKVMNFIEPNIKEPSLEHIIPQNCSIKKNTEFVKEYKDFKKDELASVIPNLGNFTTISVRLNSTQSDKLPFEKISYMESKNISHNLDNEFIAKIKNKTLNKDDIINRGEKLFEIIFNNNKFKFKFEDSKKYSSFIKDENKEIEEAKNQINNDIRFDGKKAIEITESLLIKNKELGVKTTTNQIATNMLKQVDFNGLQKKYPMLHNEEIFNIVKNKFSKQITYKQVFNHVIEKLNKDGIKLEIFVASNSKEIEKNENKFRANKNVFFRTNVIENGLKIIA